MTATNQTCTHCGMNLTMDDLRGDNCRSCGTVLPHRVRAAQQPPVGGFGAPYPPLAPLDPYTQQRIDAALRLPQKSYAWLIALVVGILVVVPLLLVVAYFVALGLVFRGPG